LYIARSGYNTNLADGLLFSISDDDVYLCRDSAEAVEAALNRALTAGAHILLTTGGVSMGDKDFIKPLLERRGKVFFGKVKMKPGKPLTFAKVPRGDVAGGEGLGDLLVFGLPGNPVSGIVTFALAVLPCMRKMEGWPVSLGPGLICIPK
jgi:gephyrin